MKIEKSKLGYVWLLGIALLAVVLIGTNTVQATVTEGCTPGYWKNHQNAWPSTYLPSGLVTTYFTEAFGAPAGMTLLEALQGGGGPGAEGAERILLRAATAALLNAASFGQPGGTPFVDVSYVKDFVVNPALNTEDRNTMLAAATLLDGWNNMGCPLN
jgi:hypothetical protein